MVMKDEAMEVRDASAGYAPRVERPVVPKGYKQTEVGVIPEDWEVFRIGDITTKVGSGITPKGGNRVYKAFGRPFVRSQNVGWGHLDLDDIAYIDGPTHATFDSTELEVGDVLLNITGASIGRVALADRRIVGGNVNQHVCLIRPNKSTLESGFLGAFLISSDGQRQIDSFQAGGNRQGLNFNQVRSIRLAAPSCIEEQRAIATALSEVDALLEALDRLIAKKRDIKQASMQQLLTGQTRLPGFEGEWEEKRLGELGHFLKGSGVRRDEAQSGSLPCVRYGEIYTIHHDVIREFQSWISPDVAAKAVRIQKGDLLFAGSGETKDEIGKSVAVVTDMEAYAGGDIVILRASKTDPVFMGYALNQSAVNLQKSSFGQGDAVVHISTSALSQIVIALPPEAEQNAIATILSDMDAELEALQQRRAKTAALKQAMMQELLTGRIRLIKPASKEQPDD